MVIRSLLQCRTWSKSDWLLASIGIVLIVYSFSLSFNSTSDSIPSVDRSDLVKLKLSSKAKERGALYCIMEAYLVITFIRVQDLAPIAGFFI